MILTLFLNISPEKDLLRRKKNYLSRVLPQNPVITPFFLTFLGFVGYPEKIIFF